MRPACVDIDPGVLLGLNLRHLREDAGLTVAQLSERLGWTAQRLTDLEAGDDHALCTELDRVRREFSCGFDALFGEPRPERRPS